MSQSESTHRRDFVRALAVGAVAAPAVIADDVNKADPPKPIDEVEARMAIVLARFGKHAQLDEKARAKIHDEVAGVVRRGEALRKVALDNGDGPFPVFHPYRTPLS